MITTTQQRVLLPIAPHAVNLKYVPILARAGRVGDRSTRSSRGAGNFRRENEGIEEIARGAEIMPDDNGAGKICTCD